MDRCNDQVSFALDARRSTLDARRSALDARGKPRFRGDA
jgi:hypothetical protein